MPLTACRYLLPVQSYVDFNFWLVVHFDNVKTSLAAKILGRGRANLPVVSNFYSPVDLRQYLATLEKKSHVPSLEVIRFRR